MLEKLSKIFSKRLKRRPSALRPRTKACYEHLVRHRDRVVGKDELLDSVWGGRVVTEQSLFQCIAEIRAAMGADCVRTVPGYGYQWSHARAGRGRAALAGALAMLAVAGGLSLDAALSREDPASSRIPVIALLPAPEPLRPLESALAGWLSERAPATLIEGPAALGTAAGADVAIRLAGQTDETVRFTIETREITLVEETATAETAQVAEAIGSLAREALLLDGRASGDAEALYDAALVAWMDGNAAEASARTRMLHARFPDFAPGQDLMLEVELVDGLLDSAGQRAGRMIERGVAQGAPAWVSAGHLAQAKVSLAQDRPDDARGHALRAVAVATAADLDRPAGKATELLSIIEETLSQPERAIDWLVQAHRHYEAARCTVGVTRVDRSLRDLVARTEY